MHKPTSPFTREQLLPKEETLELTKEKGTLFIGIPKETSFQEKRVCLTPDAVSALTSNGHRLLIESGAGENAFFARWVSKMESFPPENRIQGFSNCAATSLSTYMASDSNSRRWLMLYPIVMIF